MPKSTLLTGMGYEVQPAPQAQAPDGKPASVLVFGDPNTGETWQIMLSGTAREGLIAALQKAGGGGLVTAPAGMAEAMKRGGGLGG